MMPTKARVMALLALTAVSLLSVSPASADEGDVDIVSSSITSEFPEGFRIKVEASADFEIESIAVRLKTGQQTHGAYDYLCQGEGAIEPADWICEKFETGKVVDGELFWRTNSLGRYIPPGTIITFSFEVQDAGGIVLETEPEQFIYHDARFEWVEVSDGPITVSYHGPVKTRAGNILQAMVDTLEVMGQLLGAETEEPIRVTMYNNVKEMMDALPPGSATLGRELITEGRAFSELGTLLVLGGGRLSEGTASHELTHILVYRAGDSIFRSVPAWLNEGLAEYGNVQPGFSYDIALEFAIETGRLLPVTSMASLPGESSDVIIFYGQSRSLVRLLVQRFGPEKMKQLMATLKKGRNIDAALGEVYGLNRASLDNMWRDAIGTDRFVRSETEVSRPTPIPRRTILPFSFTPHPGAEQIASTSDDSTPTPEKTAEPTQEPEVSPIPVAAAVGEQGEAGAEPEGEETSAVALDTEAVDALTPSPKEEEAEEPASTGGGCNATPNGASGASGATSAVLLLGLVGMGLGRRRRASKKG